MLTVIILVNTVHILANVPTWKRISSKYFSTVFSLPRFLTCSFSVPFIARGPGIPKGEVSSIVSSHHDLAPTFLALAQGDEYVPSWVDGGVIPLTEDLKRHPKPVSKESFAVEFWRNEQYLEYIWDPSVPVGPNTYKTLRVIAEDYDCKFYLI